MGTSAIIEVHPFVFETAPEPFDKDIVEEPPLPTMEIRTPIRRNRSVQAQDMNLLP